GYDSLFVHKHWDDDDLLVLNICNEVVTSSLKRHETEQSVKESLSINNVIIESTSDGILLANKAGQIIYCNDNLMRMWRLGFNPVGADMFPVIERAMELVTDTAEIAAVIDEVRSDPAAQISVELRLTNGTVLEVLSVAHELDGKVAGRVWSCRDITDRTDSERERIEKGVAQAQFESLRNQINPHFLFNSLNVLSSLVHIDADLSEKFIDQLARSYRYLLEQKGKELVPLKVETDFIRSFVFLLKIRFEEKLQVNVNISASSMEQLIAPLTLQLLIENAVKHNIVSVEEPLIIDIYDDAMGCLVVRNNVQLRMNSMPSTGLGLKNIVSRYALLTERIPKFKIDGKEYTAVIPLIK
ncbi:MAG TPA: histidine kinase, partial [Sphingobacteriaceae bacterium]